MEACYDRSMEYGGVLREGNGVWRRATIGTWSMESCYHRGFDAFYDDRGLNACYD